MSTGSSLFLLDGYFLSKLLIAITGPLVPVLLLLWIWKKRNILYHSVLVAVSLLLGSMGMAKVLYVFDTPVAGGSYYFSFALVLFVLALKRFGVKRARLLLSGVLVGQVFFILASSRWLWHAALSGADGHSLASNHIEEAELVRNVILGGMFFYITGLLALVMKRAHFLDTCARVMLTLIFSLILTTPFAVSSAIYSNPHILITHTWWEMFFPTLFVRSILPSIFVILLCRDRRVNNYGGKTTSR